MWSAIASFILRFRLVLFIGLIVASIFMAYKAKDAQITYNFKQVIPESNPKYIEYQKFKKLFGEDGNVLTIGIKTDRIFDLRVFNDWFDLGNDIKALGGIEEVISVAHGYNLKKDVAKRTFIYEPLIKSRVKSQQELDSLKKVFYSLPFYRGLIYNEKTDAFLMAVTLNSRVLNSKERIQLVDNMKLLTESFSEKHNIEIYYSGLPFIRTIITTKLGAELKLFLGLALLITALILFILFRSGYMVIFPLLVVITGVIWSLGTIVLLGYKIGLLTALIPSLIVVIGIPNCIYLLNRYHAEFAKHGNKTKALARVISKVGLATFYTNLTTAIGFSVFVFTKSQLLKEFGVVSGISIMSTFLISLIFIPVIFSYLPKPTSIQTKYLENKIIKFVLEWVDVFIRKYRTGVYLVSLCLIVFAVIGLFKLKASGYIADDLPHDTKEYRDLKFLEKNFNGVMPFEIIVEANKKGGITRLPALRKLDKIQDIISEHKEFSKPISVVEGLKFITQAYYRGNEKRYKIPNNLEKNFILPYLSKVEGRKKLFESFVDSNRQIARISVQMADIGTSRLPGLLKELDEKISTVLDPDKYKYTFTGTSIVYLEGTNYLIHGLISSLLIAFLLIACLMGFLFKSFKMVLISLIPNLIPLVITAGIMGYFGIPIKPSTVLIFSIAFGIAVDTSIHFLTKYKQESQWHKWEISKRVSVSLQETGRSIIYTSLILFSGFVIFSASSFGGTVALGTLTSITLVVAMCTNLVILPALLLSFSKVKEKKIMKEPHLQDYIKENGNGVEATQMKVKDKL